MSAEVRALRLFRQTLLVSEQPQLGTVTCGQLRNMLTGPLLVPVAEHMTVARLAHRLEAQQHEPTTVVCLADLPEAFCKARDADVLEPLDVPTRELCI